MIRDEARLGSLYETPPASLDEATERTQLAFEDQETMSKIREATTLKPLSLEEAKKRLDVVGFAPTNLLDFAFNSSEEFVEAMKDFGGQWVIKSKPLPGFYKNSSRMIVVVSMESNDHEIRFWLIEKNRPKIAKIFYVRVVRSTDEEWKKSCDEALE